MKSMILASSLLVVLAAFTGGACSTPPATGPTPLVQAQAPTHPHPHPHAITLMPGPLPTADFNRPPAEPHNASDYIFKLDELEQFYKAPGEYGHKLTGADYGFEGLSFIVTETHPGGGPPFHVHDAEEAHVLLDGSAKYMIGDKVIEAHAPYIAKVPAHTPHSFVNVGQSTFNLVCVFATKRVTSQKLGPNPFVGATPPAAQAMP